MASHALKQTHQDLDVLLQIFPQLIRSAPTSGDAAAMHSTIMSIVSSRLEKCFRTLKRRHPSRTDIDALLEANKSNVQYERSIYSSMSELEQWTNAPNNTLVTSLRHTVQQLSQWASAGALQPNPPSYTHRQLYAFMKLLGSFKTVRAIVDEIKAQTDAGNGAAALDVGVSLICSPMIENSAVAVDMTVPAPPRTRMSLREMLKAEFDNTASIISKDPLTAETIVRLHRRVEAQLVTIAQAGLPTAQIDLPDVGMVDVQAQNAELDKALNDAAAATIAADLQPDQEALHRSLDQHLDLTAASGGLDLSSMGVGGAGTGDMSADMGALPDLDLGDMGGMSMDLGEDDDAWGLDFDNM
jgi:mediator of RNA polymerase II transcription subunit 5